MIKRTLYFSSPITLSTHLNQLHWTIHTENFDFDKQINLENNNVHEEDDFIKGLHAMAKLNITKNENKKSRYQELETEKMGSAPIEDIGIVILDNLQITINQALITKLLANNVALIACNDKHHPIGLMLNLEGNSLQSQRWNVQIEASIPIKKQLWQQTIQSKIYNQAALLQTLNIEVGNMKRWMNDVKSGDSENHEARAAVYYWKNIFMNLNTFERNKDGLPPNNLLNYGYAILRAICARSLVGSGLLPTLGIFHKNQYNAYCLADDIMEPYRPFVDKLVLEIINKYGFVTELNPEIKKKLLQIPVLDVTIDNNTSPLMIGMQRTTASLYKCFEGTQRKLLYPKLINNV